MGDAVNGGAATAAGATAGRAKEIWLEAMFWLSVFFGVLHFGGLAGQVAGMVAHTAFGREMEFGIKSSMLMGHLYLTFLAAYVGPKEYARWLHRSDDEVLTPLENRKITRGVYIVIGWAVFTGLVAVLWEMSLVAEVPETLLYTLGEVVALFCGTEVSKYLRNRQAVQSKQDTSVHDQYADKVLDYCRQHGSIDRPECQNAFGLSEDQAYRLLKRMVAKKQLVGFGSRKNMRYKLP